MTIYEKLQLARVKLQAKNCKKSGHNKFSGFSYYELSDFMPSVNEIFCELKLSSVFCITETEAQLKIVNAENPEEAVEFSSPTTKVELKGCTAIQAIGAVHTYMRRYLYTNALELVEYDFLDSTAGAIEAEAIETPIDYAKTIEAVCDIKQLNNTYKWLTENAKNNSWKALIKNKAGTLNAEYNKEFRQFSPC